MSTALATIAPQGAAALSAALPQAGTFARASITSVVKPRGGSRGPFANTVLTKVSTGVVRFGVEYSHLQGNADTTCKCGHVFDEDRETGRLPWGEWIDYPRVIQGEDGALYVRLYAAKGALTTTYYVDGVNVGTGPQGWEVFKTYLTPSAANPKPRPTLPPCPACGRKRQTPLTLTPHAEAVVIG